MSLWRAFGAAGLLVAVTLAAPASGQSASGQSVADIRAEVGVLNAQVQQLRDELVRRGAAGGLPVDPATALTRLDQLEAELRRLTNRIDVLTNDLDRIVQDATNRVGDIEFRLTELEGGDTSLVAPPEALGGGLTAVAPPPPRPSAAAPGLAAPDLAAPGGFPAAPAPGAGGGAQLTVTERSDFEAAVAAAEAGDNLRAGQLLRGFLETYPGGPLTSDAQFRLGEALAAQSDWQGAARSFLDAFSGAPEGPVAPRALYRLAVSLAEIGQQPEACLTLTEVDTRYPRSDVAADVAAQRQALGCQ